MITRRFFIAGSASLAVLPRVGAFAAVPDLPSRKRGNLRFGLVSDIHVGISTEDGITVQKDALKRVEQTFTLFRDYGVDAVVICGDLSSRGTVEELKAVAGAWNRVFPGGRRPDGAKVEKVFIMGNHDWEGWRYGGFADTFVPDAAARRKRLMSLDCKRIWPEIFDEDFRQFGVKTVNGYDFIQAHFIGNPDARIPLCDADCHRGIREFYAGYKADPHRPFFHVQHPSPKNTCYGPWGWGQDNGDSVAALSAFPQAIAFSGHSHYPISDGRAVWQGAFTSISCGTLALPSRRVGRSGIDIDPSTAFDIENVSREPGVSVMDFMDHVKCGRCAMLVDVYDDNMRLSRLQMPDALAIGDDWVVPLGRDRPFAFAARAKKAIAPEFPAGASLKVGRVSIGGRDCLSLKFPPADAVKGARAYDYEVTVAAEDGRKTVYRVLPPGYNGSEKGKAARLDPHCEIPVDRLPAPDGLAIEVRPCECFGRRGKPIAAGLPA